MKDSKSMIEVWQWKEAVYKDTKNMDSEKIINYFSRGTDEFLKKNGYKKKCW